LLGLLVAFNIGGRAGTGRLLNANFLQGWHTINRMPAGRSAATSMPIVVISLIWAFLACHLPSWRQPREPAKTLRYE
jgi:ABC-type lipoprotein release transport system permease subunit